MPCGLALKLPVYIKDSLPSAEVGGAVTLARVLFFARPARNVVIGTFNALATASSRSKLLLILNTSDVLKRMVTPEGNIGC